MYYQNSCKITYKDLNGQKYTVYNIELNVFTYLELTFYSCNKDKPQISLAFLNIRHDLTLK